MSFSRRRLLTLLAASAAAGEARGQPRLRVMAAGQPAAILIAALRPDALLGWPRRPRAEQLAALRPSLSRLPELGELNAAGATANMERVVALRPDLVLDYGDLGPRYQEAATTVRNRTDLSVRLLDGSLTATPAALREAGRMLGAATKAERLARLAETVLADWRRVGGRRGPSFYYGRGPDGLEAGLEGSLSTEVLEGAGWRNVVQGAAPRGLARVSLEQVLAFDPEVVVTLDGAFADRARADPRWSRRSSGARRAILRLPDRPFGWIDRPPSLNRLLGCAWAAGGDPGRLANWVRTFHAEVYGRALSVPAAAAMVAGARAS